METGGQCVMITGLQSMLMWLVVSLGTLALVCKKEQSLFTMFNLTAILFLPHRFYCLFKGTLWAKQCYHHSSG